MEADKDQMLWRQAKKRVGFRSHLASYIIINSFLWAIWYFTDHKDGESGIPWPLFCTLGWGVGLMFSFLSAYVFNDKADQVEKEYRRLKERQGN